MDAEKRYYACYESLRDLPDLSDDDREILEFVLSCNFSIPFDFVPSVKENTHPKIKEMIQHIDTESWEKEEVKWDW